MAISCIGTSFSRCGEGHPGEWLSEESIGSNNLFDGFDVFLRIKFSESMIIASIILSLKEFLEVSEVISCRATITRSCDHRAALTLYQIRVALQSSVLLAWKALRFAY